jgi:hypothetical protein
MTGPFQKEEPTPVLNPRQVVGRSAKEVAMDAKLAEQMQRQNRILMAALAAAGVLLIGLIGVVLWVALRQRPDERSNPAVNGNAGGNSGARSNPGGEQRAPPSAANKLAGVWTNTIQGPLAPITTTVEYRADGTYSGWTTEGNSDSGQYTYENGVLTNTVRLDSCLGRNRPGIVRSGFGPERAAA